MRLRGSSEIKIPKNPENLTTRQMEFLENVSKNELEALRIKTNKISSEHRVYIMGYTCGLLAILALISSILIYNILANQEGTKRLEAGYHQVPVASSNTLKWEKIKDE